MTKRTCKIESCPNPVTGGEGNCSAHWKRIQKHGDPLAHKPLRTPGFAWKFVEDLLAAKPDHNDCIIWPYALAGSGLQYPVVRRNNKDHRVSHLVLAHYVGERPSQKHMACHAPRICHNPHCLSVFHLRWDLPPGNSGDREADGTLLQGEDNPSVKMTIEKVRAIRADLRGKRTIAKEYGISPSQVGRIRRRESWGWLE